MYSSQSRNDTARPLAPTIATTTERRLVSARSMLTIKPQESIRKSSMEPAGSPTSPRNAPSGPGAVHTCALELDLPNPTVDRRHQLWRRAEFRPRQCGESEFRDTTFGGCIVRVARAITRRTLLRCHPGDGVREVRGGAHVNVCFVLASAARLHQRALRTVVPSPGSGVRPLRFPSSTGVLLYSSSPTGR